MNLWPDEHDELREEARALAPLVVEAVASPDAEDDVIAGVQCRVRERIDDVLDRCLA